MNKISYLFNIIAETDEERYSACYSVPGSVLICASCSAGVNRTCFTSEVRIEGAPIAKYNSYIAK